jgi:hypothetical protein
MFVHNRTKICMQKHKLLAAVTALNTTTNDDNLATARLNGKLYVPPGSNRSLVIWPG